MKMIHAARKGEIKKVLKWVRTSGATIDATTCEACGGDSLLHSAAVNGQSELMKELLARGADVSKATRT